MRKIKFSTSVMKRLLRSSKRQIHELSRASNILSILIGWLVCVVFPFALFWPLDTLFSLDDGQQTSLLLTSIAYLCSHLISLRIRALYPGGRSAGFLAPTVLMAYGAIILLIFFMQWPASRYLLMASGIAAMLYLYIEYTITYKYIPLNLAVLSGGRYTDDICNLNFIKTIPLTSLDTNIKCDGIVVDLHKVEDAETQRFLTRCALDHIPVYNARQIWESLTGKVKIHRMSENNMGALLPSPFYLATKRLFETLLIIFSLPITLPIAAITAILIKAESPGPVIYTQTRIGQGNKPFKIYKFRSMRFDMGAPQQFAGENDPRITRVGRVIRKLRIDELPQFLNVLKGDMSLVGPRPEQPRFVQEYDEEIPFYSYRHIVKPGITGWAQVRHGYTSNTDETQVKLEHDFYYIKNCSLTLDLIITILTIRIMLTGFGAR